MMTSDEFTEPDRTQRSKDTSRVGCNKGVLVQTAGIYKKTGGNCKRVARKRQRKRINMEGI